MWSDTYKILLVRYISIIRSQLLVAISWQFFLFHHILLIIHLSNLLDQFHCLFLCCFCAPYLSSWTTCKMSFKCCSRCVQYVHAVCAIRKRTYLIRLTSICMMGLWGYKVWIWKCSTTINAIACMKWCFRFDHACMLSAACTPSQCSCMYLTVLYNILLSIADL